MVAWYPVVEVVDGDTIKVQISGRVETVRLLGIDTPETVDPRRPVECFGREASAAARRILAGRRVRLEFDPSQGRRDKYGRILAYVRTDRGVFANLWLVRRGYAHEYTYDLPYRYQEEFRAAEQYAREHDLGLWSPSTCNGDTDRPAARPTPTPTPRRETPPPPPSGSQCDPNYAGACVPPYPPDVDCADIGQPVRVVGDDRHGLDRDGDGWGCESS